MFGTGKTTVATFCKTDLDQCSGEFPGNCLFKLIRVIDMTRYAELHNNASLLRTKPIWFYIIFIEDNFCNLQQIETRHRQEIFKSRREVKKKKKNSTFSLIKGASRISCKINVSALSAECAYP